NRIAAFESNVVRFVAMRRSRTLRYAAGVRAALAQGRTAAAEGTLVPETANFRGAGLTMHRRLRRQLEEALGQERDASPQLRRLFRRIDKESGRTELRQALAHGDTRQFLRETPTSSGARPCEWTVVPLHDSKGREVGNAALVQERDPAPDRYALAWQAAGDGIWDWDLGTDHLWLSDSWRAIVGSQGQGEAPSEWLDRVHPADRETLQSTILAHLAGCSARFESEHRLRHQNGSWRWVLARGQARRDGEGKAIRFSGSMMYISEPNLTAVRVAQDSLTRLPNRAHLVESLNRA